MLGPRLRAGNRRRERGHQQGEGQAFEHRWLHGRTAAAGKAGVGLPAQRATASVASHREIVSEPIDTRPHTRYSSSAFCACSRFSASSHTTLCGPSMTSAATSSPRCAGRQCMNSASGLARRIIAASTCQSSKRAPSRLVLGFEAHAGPHVGGHEIGALARRVADRRETSQCRRVRVAGRQAIAGRRRHVDAKVEDPRGLQPRRADVVRVADPCNRLPRDRAAMLDERVEVGEDLAWVIFVREPVDHRNARMARQSAR